jgi:hypothetical protein
MKLTTFFFQGGYVEVQIRKWYPSNVRNDKVKESKDLSLDSNTRVTFFLSTVTTLIGSLVITMRHTKLLTGLSLAVFLAAGITILFLVLPRAKPPSLATDKKWRISLLIILILLDLALLTLSWGTSPTTAGFIHQQEALIQELKPKH